MISLRRHRVAALAALAGLLAVTAIASAAISGGGPTPRPAPLAVAVHRALTAPAVPGVTARIRFTNRLVSSSALPNGASSPLISGATGRAWVTDDGRFRLELQSDRGDAQIVSDGKAVTVFDAKSNTVYTATLPQGKEHHKVEKHHGPPSLAAIRRGLAKLAREANLSGARPTNVAGQPAYSVSVSPKHDGGLLGALSLAWDAAHGTPLRVALTAQGSEEPVLELEATDISYGTVPGSALTPPSPPGAKHQRVRLGSSAMGRHAGRRERGHAVHGARAVRARLGDALRAPKTLVGLPRQEVRLVSEDGKAPRALVLYGHGLGGIAVLEERDSGKPSEQLAQLPKVSIDGATGHELPTALGTVLTWRESGARYTLVGSLPAAAAETAARDLR